MNNNLGKIIQELRNQKGYTQKGLAEKLNISDKAISRWETGMSIPHVDTLVRISKLFKVQLQDLIIAAAGSEEDDDSLVEDVIKEFTRRDKEKSKLLKIISLTFIISVFSLIVAIVFIKTYNRFKVYEVFMENDNVVLKSGMYVETRIKDVLYISNIDLKKYSLKKDDIISLDLYYIKDNKEYVLYNFSSLEDIRFSSNESYIKIKNLNKLLNNLYFRISIIKSNNEEIKYKGKLKFIMSFSNSKIIKGKDNTKTNDNSINFSKKEIKRILIDNGYEVTNEDIYKKSTKNDTLYYLSQANIFKVYYMENNITYYYVYRLKDNLLFVKIFNENDVEIEDYTYDLNRDKVIDCKTGTCYSYEKAKAFINSNIISMFK